jgi:hypothetical protein
MHTYILQGMVTEHARDLRAQADAARLASLARRGRRAAPARPVAARGLWRLVRGTAHS